MVRRNRIFLVLLVLSLFFSLFCLAQESHIVKRVVDGDTLLLANGERVRLIGVDTPEAHVSKKLYADAQRTQRDIETIQALGKKASAFTKRMAEGKHVLLKYDQANSHIGHRDRYGRILAYVYLQDGTFLNAEIIRQGYGNAYTKYPFAHMEEFRRYEREARESQRGLWADGALSEGS
jgi:micrococcal nuclease